MSEERPGISSEESLRVDPTQTQENSKEFLSWISHNAMCNVQGKYVFPVEEYVIMQLRGPHICPHLILYPRLLPDPSLLDLPRFPSNPLPLEDHSWTFVA